jgi:integrase
LIRTAAGSWLLRWREDVRSSEGTLSRARFSKVIAPAQGPGAVSKREAQRIAWETVLAKLDTASRRPQSLATVAEFVTAKFEPEWVWSLKPGGRDHYATQLKHILPALGGMRLRDVEHSHVQKLIREKVEAGYSVQTVVHIRNAVSAVFRYARSIGFYSGELPSEMVRVPVMVRKERRALTAEQVRQVLAGLRSPAREMVLTLACTGLRIGELCGLRWKHVDFEAGRIEVREAWSYGERATLKSATSVRTVPMVPILDQELRRIHGAATWKGEEDPVFAARNGQPVDRKNVLNRQLRPVLRSVGLADASWHSFRHTFSTLAEQAGGTVSERQRILGHAAGAMTMHYTHADLDRMRVVMERVADGLIGEESGRVQ